MPKTARKRIMLKIFNCIQSVRSNVIISLKNENKNAESGFIETSSLLYY